MTLYLRLSSSSISYACYEAGRSDSFRFDSHPLDARQTLAANLLEVREAIATAGQASARRIEVLADVPVTPVPLAEFQEEDTESLWRDCFSNDGTERVFYDTVPAVNVITVYALPAAVCQAVVEVFGPVTFRASLSAVMQHFAGKALSVTTGIRLFVQLRPNRADVLAYEGSRLLMVNTYDVRSLTDIDYYALNLAQHLGADLTTVPLFVAGDRENRDQAVTELRRYASHVYPVNPEADFNRHPAAMLPGVPFDLMCALLK